MVSAETLFISIFSFLYFLCYFAGKVVVYYSTHYNRSAMQDCHASDHAMPRCDVKAIYLNLINLNHFAFLCGLYNPYAAQCKVLAELLGTVKK